MQSLVSNTEFQHIIRVLNTNVDGKEKVMYALTKIRGVGRRFSNQVRSGQGPRPPGVSPEGGRFPVMRVYMAIK